MTIHYLQLTPQHFDAVIALGNEVHGANYLNSDKIQDIYDRSWANQVNASWIAVSIDQTSPKRAGTEQTIEQNKQTIDGRLLGFRLTIAAGNWTADQWCTPAVWKHAVSQVCYFKCNTVDSQMRGLGIGSTLLKKSINSARQQQARAGVAHIWMQSPANSAYGYFSANGGELVAKHANKWQIDSIEDGYECPVCKDVCFCTAAEMIIHFTPPNADV